MLFMLMEPMARLRVLNPDIAFVVDFGEAAIEAFRDLVNSNA
jgi:hypothetical protein